MKSAVFAGQDSARQPEIAPQFWLREILVGNPLPTPSEPRLRRLLVRRAHSKQVVDFQPTANSANNSIHSGTGIATPEAFLNQRPCRWDFLHGDHPNVICSGVFASIALRLVVAKTPRGPIRTGDSRGGELTVHDCTAGSSLI